jgi:hypothetical protein
MKPDFMLYDESNRLVLAVEVKATKNDNAEWAAKLRRNLMEHGVLPEAQFFLLVLPNSTYLWKDAPSSQEVAPTFSIDTRKLLKPYLPKYGDDTSRISESGLELAVRSWLDSITSTTNRNHSTTDEERVLEESGLANQVCRTSLVYGDRA